MAYDEKLAERVRAVLVGTPTMERKMFGSLALMVDGHLACGVKGDGLLVRIDPATHEQVLSEPGTAPFDMGRRIGRGWVVVAGAVCEDDDELRAWVRRGVDYVRSLPPR